MLMESKVDESGGQGPEAANILSATIASRRFEIVPCSLVVPLPTDRS